MLIKWGFKMRRKIFAVAILFFLLSSGMLAEVGTEVTNKENEECMSSKEELHDTYPFSDEYPSVQQLNEWYDDLVEQNPTITEKIHLGESWEGRDTWALKVSDNVEEEQDKPSVFINGNIHAREWSSNQVAAYYLWRIVNDYSSNETITWLVNNRRIYVAPMVNPDGYIYDGDGDYGDDGEGEWWRKNRNDSTPTDAVGVDLNRNWDINWEEGDDNPENYTYRGESPFSEYETQNLRDFILSKDIDSYQDLHSYWGTLLIPGSIVDPIPHEDWYRDMSEDMTSLTSKLGDEEEQYSYGTADEELGGYEGATPGTTTEWVYDETGAISLCYEIYTGDPYEGPHFYPPEDDIMDINLDLYDSLIYQTRIADMNLGDGDEYLYPPSPYIVYGNINEDEGDPVKYTNVTIENLDTGEKIHTNTDHNGYYEVNFGNFVEEGYENDDTFSIHTEGYSVNFTIDDSWGQRLDIDGPESYQLTVEVEGEGTVEVDGEEITEYPYEEVYDRATQVELKAVPEEGWYFDEWSGTDKNEEEIKITIEQNKVITAHFTDEPPQKITDWYDLDEIRVDLDGDHTLGSDLDEDSEGYEDVVDNADGFPPIGYEGDPFTGSFEGDGHEIKDLYINRQRSDHVGLFGYTDSAEITDLGIVDINVKGDSYVGGLIGYNDGGKVSNSYVTGDVSGEGSSIGGLIGRNYGTVINSYAAGTVSETSHSDGFISHLGGLVGSNYGPVSNSYASCEVSGDQNVGGFAGINHDTIIENSYATGDVSGEEWVGGLLGGNGGVVENSYATGDVSGEEHVGGLVGVEGSRATVSNSFWDVDTSGQDYSVGGTGKTTEEMKDVATYTDTDTKGLLRPWDFVGDPYDDEGDEYIWHIDEDEIINDGYPFLTWEYQYTLDVNTEGEGSVDVDPDKDEYEPGSEVTLTANPDEGWEFEKWTGDVPEGEEEEDTINVIMDDDKEITAVFEEEEDDEEEDDDIPGFTSTIMLISALIAVAIYKKKKV